MKKIMKSAMSVLLAFAMVFGVCAVGTVGIKAEAAENLVEGIFEYTVENGEATIVDYDGTQTENVKIPSTLGGYPVITIAYGAFSDDYFNDAITKTISIPASVEHIEEGAFSNLKALERMTVVSGNNNYANDTYGVLFNKDKTQLVAYPIGNENASYTVPSSVKTICKEAFYNSTLKYIMFESSTKLETIGDSAFYNNCYLESITVPASVTSIGATAFAKCRSLSSITVDAANANYSNDSSGVLFDKNKTKLIACPVGNAVTSYTVPASVTEIEEYAFFDTVSLKTVTFESGSKLETVGEKAFFASYISNITLPDSVKKIEEDAFLSCIYLKKVDLSKNTNLETIEKNAFGRCVYLEEINLPASLKTIDPNALEGADDITVITLDPANEYYTLDSYGVLYTKDMASIVRCPAEVSFTSYTIPSTVRTIEANAFRGCKAITSIVIPEGVETIGELAFKNCMGLTEITFPDSLTSVSRFAFENCRGLLNVTFGKDCKLETIPTDMFSGCYDITTVRLPKNLKTIGEGAFANSSDITDVYYPGTPEEWKEITVEKYNGCLLNATIRCGENGDIIVEPEDPEEPDVPDVPDIPVTPDVPTDAEIKLSIKTPSTTKINYGETLILHADATNIPEGASIMWFVSGKGVSTPADKNEKICKIKSTGSGTVTVTVKVAASNGEFLKDADGKEISDSVKITSDGSFWQRILSFLKDLFRIDRVIDR